MAGNPSNFKIPSFLDGGGEMGSLMRNYNWEASPLGNPDHWPPALKTSVRICLDSRFPIVLWWGPELRLIYNDAWRPSLGTTKHPWALGSTGKEVWSEIWDTIGPMLNKVMTTGEATWENDQLLLLQRHGYLEESYWTYSYSAIRLDDGTVGGVFAAVHETTETVLGERYLRTLKDLGRVTTQNKTNEEVYRNALQVLGQNGQDFPFALLYNVQENGRLLQLSGATTDSPQSYNIPNKIQVEGEGKIEEAIRKAYLTSLPQRVEGIDSLLGEMPKGNVWEEAPKDALIMPLVQSGHNNPYVFLIIGLNPYRPLDEKYSGFFRLIGDQLSSSLSHVHVLEEERKRVEALAAIDRAKTTFFSNISHELRTPLTLMLGPLEEVLEREDLDEKEKENLRVSHRNTLRLQKLVNTLLEFSRIEAGRVQAKFQPVDLPKLSRDLASTFQSAIEKAGLDYSVHFDSIKEPLYVDVDMWERIVLNLISNAFKYTDKGSITVGLEDGEEEVRFFVRDSGIGIPDDEKDKIFERFHRIDSGRVRSQEGTGIGLSLVQELVRIHKGVIEVHSKVNEGSTFTIILKKGKDHLPEDKIGEGVQVSISSKNIYVEEASQWNSDIEELIPNATLPYTIDHIKDSKPKILLADDNTDMREYISRLLSGTFDVTAVKDGAKALDYAVNNHFDLLISDVMMPGMSGFELVEKIKSHGPTNRLPIILLSARAGEEATIEGLNSGADDYLVKPFSAKELISRVESTIRLNKARTVAERNLYNLFHQAPVGITILKGPHYVIDLINKTSLEVLGKPYHQIINKPLFEAFPETAGMGYEELMLRVYNGESVTISDSPALVNRGGKEEMLYLTVSYTPYFDESGKILGIMSIGMDVTEHVLARRRAEESEDRQRLTIESAGMGVWTYDLRTGAVELSEKTQEIFGYDTDEKTLEDVLLTIVEEDRDRVAKAVNDALTNENGEYVAEYILYNKIEEGYRAVSANGKIFRDLQGKPVKMFGTCFDITNQKLIEETLDRKVQERTRALMIANQQLERSNAELEQFAFVTSHDLQEPLRKIQTFSNILSERTLDQLGDKANSYLLKINSSARRMSFLISDLLNYSRLSRSEQHFVKVDLNEVLQNIRNDFEILIEQKSARIEASGLPTIEALPLQMNQLFYNLISNALKFTREGVPPLIRIKCAILDEEEAGLLVEGGQNYEIKFSDNGIGFPQEYSEKIFEIFQRLNTRTEFEGTGIGLALVSRIVSNHKGRIEAHSKEGEGTTFRIILPQRQ